MVQETFEIIKSINKQGTTVLLVEQNARLALEIADWGYVLQGGSVQLADKASSLMNNDVVRKLYLGEN
jgi:branched-chain amino acid transport system ATP-binding protein